MTRISLKLAAAAAAFIPAVASAQLTFSGPLAGSGNGLGAVLTVLTLNNTDDISTGCITPMGTSGCGFPDNTVQQSSTVRSIAEIGGDAATLGTDLRIVANFSEPQNDLDGARVDALTLFLFGANGTTTFTLNSAQAFPSTNSGVGNIGFGFSLTEAGALAFQSALAGAGANASIGLGAALSNVQGGLDTFQITRVTSTAVIPEPSTYALMGAGLLSLGGMAARRRRTA